MSQKPGHKEQHALDALFAQAAQHQEQGQTNTEAQELDALWLQMEARMNHAAQAEAKEETKVVMVWWQRSVVQYAAAAVVLIALGFGFMLNKSTHNSAPALASNPQVETRYPEDTHTTTPASDEAKPSNSVISAEVATKPVDNSLNVVDDQTASSSAVYMPNKSVQVAALESSTKSSLVQPAGRASVQDSISISPEIRQLIQQAPVAQTSEPKADEMDMVIEVRPSSKRDQRLAKQEPDLAPLPEAAQNTKTAATKPSWFTRMNDWRKGRNQNIESDTTAQPKRLRLFRE